MDAPKEIQPTGDFTCQLCGLTAPYTYYGHKPPNKGSIVLLEDAYVMKDPFTPDKDKFLILGSHCSLCSRSVCVGAVSTVQPYKKSRRRWLFSTFLEQGKAREIMYHYKTFKECSLFYSKRFCLPCVKENLKAFPLEIQEDMNKRKPQQKSFSCKKRDKRT